MNRLVCLLVLMHLGEHIKEKPKEFQVVYKLALIAGMIESTIELLQIIEKQLIQIIGQKQIKK